MNGATQLLINIIILLFVIEYSSNIWLRTIHFDKMMEINKSTSLYSSLQSSLSPSVTHEVIDLFRHIVTVVGECVGGYYLLFAHCWDKILDIFCALMMGFMLYMVKIVELLVYMVIHTITISVMGYYWLFDHCWNKILDVFGGLMFGYMVYMVEIVKMLTIPPFIYVGITGVVSVLLFLRSIV
jgi:hypothetical protein